MSKAQVFRRLVQRCPGLRKKDINSLYGALMGLIESDLCETGKFRLHGVGTLRVIMCEEKKYRNPRNGAIIVAPQQKRVRFRPSKVLAEMVNNL